MKKITSVIVVLLMVVMATTLVACSKNSGSDNRYSRKNSKTDYIELKTDQTFVLVQDNKEYKGEYQITDGKLTIKSGEGFLAEGTIKEDQIVDDDGIVWEK